jgi:large subunit ribosomal protein L3
MVRGLLGRKIGMTRVFGPEGNVVPVTVLEVGPCTIVRVKSEEGKDGYNALLLGWGEVKAKRLNKPRAGLFAKQQVEPCRYLREMPVTAEDAKAAEVGAKLDASLFSVGTFVDVQGTTKGRGFTGVIKRHNFRMPKATHGTHEYHRHSGSIGNATSPGRVVKGRRMAGRYGNERVTVQNLLVVGVEPEKNLLLVKGGVPGPNGRLVWVQRATKLTHW